MIDYIESRHEYSVNGRVLPSVTRILVGLGLLRTVDDEAALQRGRAVHEACRMHDVGTLITRSVDSSIVGYLESWKALLWSKPIRMTAYERKVANIGMGCAGRYDRKVVIDGELGILELKTGEVQELPVRLQLVGYAEMERRLNRRNVVPNSKGNLARFVVRLFPDGSMAHLQKFPAVDYQRDLGGFLSAVNLYTLGERYGQ